MDSDEAVTRLAPGAWRRGGPTEAVQAVRRYGKETCSGKRGWEALPLLIGPPALLLPDRGTGGMIGGGAREFPRTGAMTCCAYSCPVHLVVLREIDGRLGWGRFTRSPAGE